MPYLSKPARAGLVLLLPLAAWCGQPQPAMAYELEYPLAVAAQGAETIFVADRNLPGIWKIDGGVLQLYFLADKKLRTPLNAPRCLAIDHDGRLLAGDSATREVYRFAADGTPEPLTGGEIGIPMGIAVDAAGDLLVTDLERHCVWKVPAAGGAPVKLADVPAPRGVWLDSQGRLWIVSRGPDELLRMLPGGKVEVVVKGRPFEFAHNVVLDEQGIAYVTDGYAKTVWKIDPDGQPVRWAKSAAFVNPVGLAWQGEKLLVADSRAKALFQIDSAGQVAPLEFKAEGSAE